MLRITESPAVQLTTINFQGKLLAAWIAEAQAAVASAKKRGAVRLNLNELSYADRDGIVFLKQLRMDGIELINITALIEGLLAMPD
jgi:hypothetical protein